MPYAQTVIDNFNDNSFNTAIWATPSGATGIAETSGALRVSALSTYPEARSTQNRNAATGIVGVKLSHTGTGTASTEMYFGISDSAGNMLLVGAAPLDSSWTITSLGNPVVGTRTLLQATFWSTWTEGNWLGIGNIGSDNIVHVYKSSDGITWTEIGYAPYTGTFAKTAVGISFTAGVFSSTSTWVGVIDDASYFAYTALGKVRVGGAWVTPTAVKVRSGGAWVIPSAMKVRSGGVWVTPTA